MASSQWQALAAYTDGEWSDGRVTLLDYEDGTKRCDESGNLLMNHQIKGSLPNGDYQAIRFRVGVPPELNHQDVTTADAPLNTSSILPKQRCRMGRQMFSSWLRFDITLAHAKLCRVISCEVTRLLSIQVPRSKKLSQSGGGGKIRPLLR